MSETPGCPLVAEVTKGKNICYANGGKEPDGAETSDHDQGPAYLERRLQVVFIAFGKELVGVGRRPVLVEVFEVLQVGAEVLVCVPTGSCDDELHLQLTKHRHVCLI